MAEDQNDELTAKTVWVTVKEHLVQIFHNVAHLRTTYMRRFSKLDIVESADFEEPDGENIRLAQSKKTWKDTAMADLFSYGLASVTAILIALCYLCLHFSSKAVDEWRIGLVSGLLLNDTNIGLAFLYYFIPMVVLSLAGALAVMYEPAAAGSGMPEVISNLNGIRLTKQLNLRVLITRHFSLICILTSGLYSGYDGPTAYTGLMIASLMFSLVEHYPKLSRLMFADKASLFAEKQKDLENILHITHKKFGLLFAASGAASGIASAFHAPLGGSVFALEEAISFFNPSIIIRTLFSCLIAYLVVGAITNYKRIAPVIYAVEYALFPNDAECTSFITWLELLGFALMGALAGVAGHLYNKLIIFILKFKIRHFWPRPWLRLFEVFVVCVITSLCVIFIPASSLGDCKPFRQAVEHVEYISFDCLIPCNYNVSALIESQPRCYTEVCISSKMRTSYEIVLLDSVRTLNERCLAEGNTNIKQGLNFQLLADKYVPPKNLIHDKDKKCYYSLYSLMIGSPDQMLRLLFSRGAYNLFDISTLSVFTVVYLFLSVITHNIMLPTDLVLPNIILGASFGRLYGVITNYFLKQMNSRLVDPGAYALLGAAALWSGTSRIALTIAIIMMETTFDFESLPGALVVVAIASIVGNWFGHSLYHMEIETRKFPYLPDTTPSVLYRYSVKDLIRANVVYFKPQTSAKELYKILSSCAHQGFPIVEEIIDKDELVRYRPIGTILRSQLRHKFLEGVKVTREQDMELQGSIQRGNHISFEGSLPASLQRPSNSKIGLYAKALRERSNSNVNRQSTSINITSFAQGSYEKQKPSITVATGSNHSTLNRYRQHEKQVSAELPVIIEMHPRTSSADPRERSISLQTYPASTPNAPQKHSNLKDFVYSNNAKDQDFPRDNIQGETAESESISEVRDDGKTPHIKYNKTVSSLEEILRDEAEGKAPKFDLSLLMSHPVHTVNQTMSARKAYTMFRQLGLRHLCVVDDNNYLVGFVTRKDFSHVIHSEHEHEEIHESPIGDTQHEDHAPDATHTE